MRTTFTEPSGDNDGYSLRETGKMDISHRPDYVRKARASSHYRHQVIVSIKQNNLDKVNELLYEVSTMSSPMYGRFLSFEEVGDLVNNQPATDAVKGWLQSSNVSIVDQTPYGEYITAEASVSTWEQLLRTEMHEYEPIRSSYDDSMKTVVRGLSYSVPAHLDEHIFAIHEFTNLPPQLTHHSRWTPLPTNPLQKSHVGDEEILNDNSYMDPNLLQSIYGIAGTGNDRTGSQAVYGALGQTFLPSDLMNFQRSFNLVERPVSQRVGRVPSSQICNRLPEYCVEGSLDVQYLTAVGQNISTTYWYDSNLSGSFLSFVISIAASSSASLIYSISYGSYEYQVSPSYLSTFNTEAQKAGLRGITLVAATGDDGVTGFNFRPSSSGSYSLSQCGYYASWPASSPFVTAVGATMNGFAISGTAEIACSARTGAVITTGGGFSNSLAAPQFQRKAVDNYFSQITPPQSSRMPYTKTNRGYPDISMPGHAYIVHIAGRAYSVSGTSASAPVFAGMVALVNAYRIRRNKTSGGLGWLNPSIYASDGSIVLNDITSGDNYCTADADGCCSIGFTAITGWDPVTGFGSVDYNKFLSYFGNITETSEAVGGESFSSSSSTSSLLIIIVITVTAVVLLGIVMALFILYRLKVSSATPEIQTVGSSSLRATVEVSPCPSVPVAEAEIIEAHSQDYQESREYAHASCVYV